jgi:hypothetical protein
MKAIIANRVKEIIYDERGGIGIVILVIVFIALLLTPFLLHLASVQYARRMAQTGADAATMAGAVELAECLSLWNPPIFSSNGDHRDDREGAIEEAKRKAINYYYQEVYRNCIRAGRGLVMGKATEYASQNKCQLVNRREIVEFAIGSRSIDGYLTVRFFIINGDVERLVKLWGWDYGREFKTPARATAEVYLPHRPIGWDWWGREGEEFPDVDSWPCPECYTVGEEVVCTPHTCYRAYARLPVRWKVRLIK